MDPLSKRDITKNHAPRNRRSFRVLGRLIRPWIPAWKCERKNRTNGARIPSSLHLLVLNPGNFREWSTITNNHPSNPGQPIHSLRKTHQSDFQPSPHMDPYGPGMSLRRRTSASRIRQDRCDKDPSSTWLKARRRWECVGWLNRTSE